MDDSSAERRDSNGSPGPAPGDFEKLLDLAENLERERDRERADLDRYAQRTYLFALLCAFFGLGIAGVGAAPDPTPDALLWVALAVLTASLAVGVSRMWHDRWLRASKRRELEASERALFETVQILRETEHAHAEEWSTLDRARFRIRLSRFDVGPDGLYYTGKPKSSFR